MSINSIGSNTLPQSLPTVRNTTETPVERTSQNVESSLPVLNQADSESAEVRRFEQVRRAAESFFEDVYAVNDYTFSIYKDASGQYITRFTSLRDGRVTYIPEPQILQQQSRRGSGESLIEIQA